MRVSMFIILFFFVAKPKFQLSKKQILLFLLALVIVFGSFSFLGNYRQAARGSTNFEITEKINSRIDNDAINWVYAYSAFNFEVLNQTVISGTPTGEIKELVKPLTRLVNGNEAVAEDVTTSFGINGINATTFLSPFIREVGGWYFAEIAVLALIVGVIGRICSSLNFVGGYSFLCMLTALTIFTDYYLQPVYFFSILLGIFFFAIIKFMLRKNGNPTDLPLGRSSLKPLKRNDI